MTMLPLRIPPKTDKAIPSIMITKIMRTNRKFITVSSQTLYFLNYSDIITYQIAPLYW